MTIITRKSEGLKFWFSYKSHAVLLPEGSVFRHYAVTSPMRYFCPKEVFFGTMNYTENKYLNLKRKKQTLKCKRDFSRNHFQKNITVVEELTLNVRGQSYIGSTRSISWLLMPWLFTWPGHQQPWNWLCRICCRSGSYTRKGFKDLCHTSVE